MLTWVFVKLAEEIKMKKSKKYIMTNDDIKYRQGRSKKQADNNEKIMFISCIGLAVVILGIIIYGFVTHG